jgi:molecular chaperone DnaK (HSP70)
MIQADDWAFAVDFGTTTTVAAVDDVYGVRPLTVNGVYSIPSAVMLTERGNWRVGELAISSAHRRMDSFETAPKNLISYGTIWLGGRPIPVVDAITAVFRFVAEEAQKQRGPAAPSRFVVTHPAGWEGNRIGLLLEAAHDATDERWPDPEPLEEPVAAVQSAIYISESTVPTRARIVVMDVGRATVDIAIVDRDGSQHKIVGAPDGIDGVGGAEFDLRLAHLIADQAGNDGLYSKLLASDNRQDRELALDIRQLARHVNEQLCVDTPVSVQVPVPSPNGIVNRIVQVSRAQFEDLVRGGPGRPPGFAEAIRLVAKALQEAPPGPPFAGVCLVGGSSRIPLLARMLYNESGLLPLSQGDPRSAVAEGAALWTRSHPKADGRKFARRRKKSSRAKVAPQEPGSSTATISSESANFTTYSPIDAFNEAITGTDRRRPERETRTADTSHSDALVFLCHSSGDKELVRNLYRRLTADNITCWFDEENLLAGQDWDHEISRAIRRSRFVLACVSNASVSKVGYVQKELRKALDVADEQPEGVAFLIPVRLEECEIPTRLNQWQYVDLFKSDGYDRLVRGLRAGIAQ